MMQIAAKTIVALVLWALCGPGTWNAVQAAESAAQALRVELLDADLSAAAADSLPNAPPRAEWEASGIIVQRALPYRRYGSWIRITLPSALPSEPLLVVTSLAAGPVTLVLPDGQRIVRSKLDPSPDKDASAIAEVFPLPPTPGPHATLLMHIDHQHHAITEFELISAESWRQHERFRLIVAAALYSALITFAIIAICYLAVLRERMFADYALYLLSLVGYMASSSGVLYAWPGGRLFGLLGIHGQWAIVTASLGFVTGFVCRFLDVGRYAPRLAVILERIRIAMLCIAAAILLSPFSVAWYGMTLVGILFVINVTFLSLGAYGVVKGNRYAWYFLAGWIPLATATTLRGLHATGLISVSAQIPNWYAIGAVCEGLFLTLGIADRVLAFRRERDVARLAAERDALTGVLNRRALDIQLRALIGEARGTGGATSFAMLFLDIDHFKSINDRYGHAVGDTCLVAVARRLSDELRGGDFLGRWGGEEFIALLPGASLPNARRTSERILNNIANEPVHAGDLQVSITVSIGIAVFDPARDDAASLIDRADAALYRAKNNGRNRIEGGHELAAA
jgi:diguanylate cyclase (GGDEF)-like protein